MDQIKIGTFLKLLRKEKNLTQEQLAEQLGVSNRTVSRWENGNNMPDISLLSEIAEFYDVSIPELIYGERKSENMREEAKEVAETMSDYAKAEKETLVKSIRNMFPLYTTGLLSKIRIRTTNSKFKNIPVPAIKIIGFIAAFAIAALIRIWISKSFG